MLALLGYGMIVTFMVLLLAKKMSPFAALILVPVVFGLAAAFISGTPLLEVFDWIFGGLYYSLDENKMLIGKGVAPTITLLLFAILCYVGCWAIRSIGNKNDQMGKRRSNEDLCRYWCHLFDRVAGW